MGASLGATEPVPAAIDTSKGINAGNWTAVVTPQIFGISLPEFEVYRIAIDGGPPGSTLIVYIGNSHWDTAFPGNDTAWDPNQPMPVQQGQTVHLYWRSNAAPMPTATLWMRERSPL